MLDILNVVLFLFYTIAKAVPSVYKNITIFVVNIISNPYLDFFLGKLKTLY